MNDLAGHGACCEGRRLELSRRRLLTGAAAVAGAGFLELAGASVAFAAPGRPRGDLLVVVSLRGGADGLTLVPPVADPAYAAARPGIAVTAQQAIPLDRTFGLHPALEPLLPYWRTRTLAVVQAVGSSDGSRSHFEATASLERGTAGAGGANTGWLDRHLTSRGLRDGDFPALAVGSRAPYMLYGPAPEVAAPSVASIGVRAPEQDRRTLERALTELHSGVAGPVAESARVTLDVLSRVAPAQASKYVPRAGVRYPSGGLGHALQQVAQLARAGVGLEVACVDAGGWDTHAGMGGAAGGRMAGLVGNLGLALAAFARDLGPLLTTTTIVTVSEFGRRVAENGSGGLDHGRGNAMLLLGGGVRGGRVHGRWPGLRPQDLDDGDLRVTTDYRDVLAEVVARRLGNGRVQDVFPGHRPRALGVVTPG